jgi:branched-chain amino acid transport system permease protein
MLRAPSTLAGLSLVGLLITWLGINAVKTPSQFAGLTLIGLTLGCVYALIALGYTLVWGILELINFAHGDVFMLGSMFTITFGWRLFGVGSTHGIGRLAALAATLALTMICCAAVNASIELIGYRRLRQAPRLAALISAIGASFIIEDIALVWKGPNYLSVANVLPQGELTAVGGVAIRWDQLIVVSVTTIMLVGLLYIVERTRYGKAMRAVAEDMNTAAMLGIDVNRTISFTFALAGALAGVAGLLYALYETSVRYDQGFELGLIAFTAAVLGGVGNLIGTIVGSLAIGLIQSFNEGLSWHAPGSDWTESVVFAILVTVLVFRPQGLLGDAPDG